MDKEKIRQDWKDEALKAIQSGRVLTADEEMDIILRGAESQLTAANKAIVALSEALEDIAMGKTGFLYPEQIAQQPLTDHADAIKRARGE